MATHNARQLFLDESGRLVGHPDPYDPLLVVGVLLFGAWDRADDTRLRSVLKRRLNEVGGRYPADLHLSESALTPALTRDAALLRLALGGIRRVTTWWGDSKQRKRLAHHADHGRSSAGGKAHVLIVPNGYVDGSIEWRRY